MQFIPYKINHDNPNHVASHFENEFKMIKILQTLDETLEFIEEQAIEVVKFKEGGEKALDCKCTRSTIGNMRDGYLLVVEDDGTFTLVNKVSGTVYGYTVTPVTYFKFDSFSCSARATTRPAKATNDNRVSAWDELLRELTSGRKQLRHVESESNEDDVPEAPPVPKELREYFEKLNEPMDIFSGVRETLKTTDDGELFYFRSNDRIEFDPFVSEYTIKDKNPREWKIDVYEDIDDQNLFSEYKFGLQNDDQQSIDNQLAKAEQEAQFGKDWMQFDYFAKKYQ